MTEFSRITEQLAAAQIAERHADAARHRTQGTGHRPRGRHAFAQRLHRLAERIDT